MQQVLKDLSQWGDARRFRNEIRHLETAQRELAEKTRAKIEAQAAHMQKFVDRFRYKASKAKQAQSKLKAIEKLRPPALLEEAGTMPFRFSDPERISASPMIKLENINCGYSEGEPILANIKLNIDSDDRIALLGANGNGKSTFAKLLSNRLPFVDGTVVKASRIQIGMFAQHQMDDLNPNQTPVEHIRPLMPQSGEALIRSAVAQMGLNHERMDTKCSSLSGGEKARLLLGLCAFDAPDLLILDEPTNHLDVGAREALANAINAYKGAVILISHDRHLIDATTERLWLVNDGQVLPYEGDLDEYRQLVLRKNGGGTGSGDAAPTHKKMLARQAAADKRKELAPLRAKIAEKEKQIEKLEEAIRKLDSSLSTPDIFEKFPDKAAKFSKQRAEAGKMLEAAESQWIELEAELEAAS